MTGTSSRIGRPTRRDVLRASAKAATALLAVPIGMPARGARDDSLRILCSGPAGSIPDLIARAVGEQLPATLGQRALIDNRPGAAGRIAVGALKAAPGDGSTLLLAQGAVAVVYPFLYTKLGSSAMTRPSICSQSASRARCRSRWPWGRPFRPR